MRALLLAGLVLFATVLVAPTAAAGPNGFGHCTIVMDPMLEVYGTGTPLDGRDVGVPRIYCVW